MGVVKNLSLDKLAARKMYDAGLPDTRISKELGVARSTVRYWRKREGLEANFAQGEVPPDARNRRVMFGPTEARALEMYEAGANDHEIGRELSINSLTIRMWRVSRNLPSKYVHRLNPRRKTPRASTLDKSEARKLYGEGCSDGCIGERLGVSSGTVWYWRKREGLPPNFQPSVATPKVRYPPPINRAYSNPLWARAARAVSHRVSPDLADDAISEIVLAVLEGRLSEDRIEREAGQFINRTLRLYASRWGPRSLDETHSYLDGANLYDFIADPAQSIDMRMIELSLLASHMGIDTEKVLSA